MVSTMVLYWWKTRHEVLLNSEGFRVWDGSGQREEEQPEEVPKPNGRGGSRRRRNPPSGGVLAPRDAKSSWAVNIRPKNWGDKDKIWWGKIKSMKEAQRISDIVHFYLGCDSVHLLFPSSTERPPPFRNSNLHHLASLELRMKYVKLIAKGDEHQARRKELMESVKDMIKLLTVETADEDDEVPWTLVGEVPALGGVGDDECRLSPQIPDLHQGTNYLQLWNTQT